MAVHAKPQMSTLRHLNKSTLGFVNGAIGIVQTSNEPIDQDPDTEDEGL